MILLSCVNCCHNPLQTDSLGTAVGYCTQHRKVLLTPTQLTCGRHFRKDLPAVDAVKEQQIHARTFPSDAIVRLTAKGTVNGGYTSTAQADVNQLAADPVGDVVLDYGSLPSKIASLAQLHVLQGVRPELAMLSLGRVYVNRCVGRGGAWTSGVHLLWWTRRRLGVEPQVGLGDLRVEAPIGLTRQIDLAKWTLVMMRLIFISDVASYAPKSDRVSRLVSLAERAAEETGALSPHNLLRWIDRTGDGLVAKALPESRYDAIRADLRRRAEADPNTDT